MTAARDHSPLAVRKASRCRVDCSCGWRGPLSSTFGEGYGAWNEHFYAVASPSGVGTRPDTGTEEK